MSSPSSLFKTKLLLYFDFEASHSLDVREEPHLHFWKTTFTFSGEPVKGRIVDFPSLENAVKKDLASLPNSYLNENPDLLPATRAFPTCESLGESIAILLHEKTLPQFRAENPTLRINSVQVTLCEGERIYGSAITELVP